MDSVPHKALRIVNFCDAKTADDLDWRGIRDALAARTATPRGREIAAALGFDGPLADAQVLRAALRTVEEARAITAAEGPAPFGGVGDLRAVLTRAAHGQVLEASELLAVAATLSATHAVRDYLALGKERAPLLWQNGQALVPIPQLAKRLAGSFDADGNVADAASPELARARAESRRERSRAIARLEQIVQSPDYAPYLQDSFYTLRDDRFVVPLKAHAKARFGGVVHNASQTGETFFVEPNEIVDVNNRLRIAEAAVQQEVYRVLVELSQAVTERAATLEADAERLAALDLTFAKAALADILDAHTPEITDGGPLVLEQARHPLLALRLKAAGRTVVANRIRIDPGSALVVSGLNAGGKTVVLKTAGACVLMAHAGIPLPCDAGSRVPLMKAIRSDVADDQSIDRDLSTFSGQIERLKTILSDAGTGSLVLVDELAVGTEPGQGAALAQACIEALVTRGSMVVATTHYDRLKTLSSTDARFTNAAVGIDPQSLAPTYELIIGVPGASGAFETARRFGLDSAIVARAVELTGPAGQSLDRLLTDLQTKAHALDQERASVRDEIAAAAKARLDAESALAKAAEERRTAAATVRDELLCEVQATRDELAARVRELQRQNAPEVRTEPGEQARHIQEARDVVATLDKKLRARPGVTVERVFAAGDAVHVRALGRDGVVASIDERRGLAVVQLGGLKTTVAVFDLESPRRQIPIASQPPRLRGASRDGAVDQPNSSTGDAEPFRSPLRDARDSTQSASSRVDLRGMRVDEALAELERTLDRAYGAGETAVLVVHGYGTGALRGAVRETAERSPVASSVRAATDKEGGDAVTVILLRA